MLGCVNTYEHRHVCKEKLDNDSAHQTYMLISIYIDRVFFAYLEYTNLSLRPIPLIRSISLFFVVYFMEESEMLVAHSFSFSQSQHASACVRGPYLFDTE